MLRIVLLPLLLFTISMACMGQTFQYSRGWTNGKRSLLQAKAQQQQQQQGHQRYLTAEDNIIDPDFYNENMLERYFLQMPHFMRNAILARSGLSLRPTATSTLTNNGLENGNGNNNNNLYGNHHQSNELFEELSGNTVLEATDYGKH